MGWTGSWCELRKQVLEYAWKFTVTSGVFYCGYLLDRTCFFHAFVTFCFRVFSLARRDYSVINYLHIDLASMSFSQRENVVASTQHNILASEVATCDCDFERLETLDVFRTKTFKKKRSSLSLCSERYERRVSSLSESVVWRLLQQLYELSSQLNQQQ